MIPVSMQMMNARKGICSVSTLRIVVICVEDESD